MAKSNRAARRRENKAVEKGAAPAVDVTLSDVQKVLNENPIFRQAVVNAALQRHLAEANMKLAVYETVAEGAVPESPPGEPVA